MDNLQEKIFSLCVFRVVITVVFYVGCRAEGKGSLPSFCYWRLRTVCSDVMNQLESQVMEISPQNLVLCTRVVDIEVL